jgi:hypothetical protein
VRGCDRPFNTPQIPKSLRSSRKRLFGRALVASALLASGVGMSSVASVSAAAQPYRVDLRVLVLDDGSETVGAIKAQMDFEGVPYTAVAITSAVINTAFLSSGNEAKFQAVVAPDYTLSGLDAGEVTTLRAYEAKFGVREVDTYNYPAAGIGMNTPVFSGDLNGVTATVNAAGKAAGFGYLNGPVPFSIGSYTYLATPLPPASLPPGASFTPLVEAPGGGITGSVVGVYANAGVEQMVITAAFASTFMQFKYLGHGIITWMTRGIHLGYNRNNFTFHIDDAFSQDALWDSTQNCTPGEDCFVTPGTDARMSPDDVAVAAAWTQANNYQFTLAFNGFYADLANDPLTQSLVANKAAFRWLNHGFEHIYQGCQQDFTTVPWKCVVDAGLNNVWVTQQAIYNEIHNNIVTGQQLGLSFALNEYLSGEHSGLQFQSANPGQTQTDNPNFIAALAQAGITRIGSDASREATARAAGTATTIPRHPTALFYNTATKAQAVDEYNWIYTSAADGGSGMCTATATCITPLDLTTGFNSYIIPTATAFDMGFILSNDPRPFYAHTSNLTGDRLAYYLLDGILNTYRAAFNAATPPTNLTVTQAADQLIHQQQWTTDKNTVTGYVLNGAVTITNTTGHGVPFTAPVGSTIAGATLEPYGGEVSAWLTAGSKTGTVPDNALVVTGPVFQPGVAHTMTIVASGMPTATVSFTGALPAGLVATTDPGTATITITGTAAAASIGNYPLLVTVIGAASYRTDTVTLSVSTPPVFTSAASSAAVTGSPFSFTITTTGSPAAVISMTGALPTGITFTPGANGTATLSGTAANATAGNTYPLTLTATNIGGVTTQAFTLSATHAPQFTSAGSATAVVGKPFSFTITTVGSPAAAITMTGALPSGIAFTPGANGTATLSGTAADATAGHTYPVTLTATNTGGVTTQAFTLSATHAPQFTSAGSANAVAGKPFSFTVTTVGSPSPAITRSGTLPAGITFTDLGNGTATLAGTAVNAQAGQSFPVTLTATNSFGVTPQAFTLSVVADDHALMSLAPARLADTRPGFATVDGQFAGEGARAAGSTLELVVAGRGGVPADAAAVALNVTVAEPIGSGFVTVFPCGSLQPLASNLNYTMGAVVPNAVMAKVGADGKVCLFVSNGTQLIVDVNGYFPSSSSFHSMNPARVLDTRPGETTVDGLQQGAGLRSPGTITELQITGRASVPLDATSVVLNVTVTEAQAAGFVTVYPCGTAIPTASNINFVAGSTVANLVVAKIGAGGAVCIFNNQGTHLVADVNGYFPGSTSYHSLDPARLLDTRPGMATIDTQSVGAGLLPSGTVTELTVAGRGGVPANAGTVLLNVTVTGPTVAGFITVYPCGIATPLASNLNYGIGTTVAIAAVVQVGSNGKVCLFNSGATHLVADVNGYLST